MPQLFGKQAISTGDLSGGAELKIGIGEPLLGDGCLLRAVSDNLLAGFFRQRFGRLPVAVFVVRYLAFRGAKQAERMGGGKRKAGDGRGKQHGNIVRLHFSAPIMIISSSVSAACKAGYLACVAGLSSAPIVGSR